MRIEFIKHIYNGIYKVKRNGKYNIINKQNKILSKTWFDFISVFNINRFIVKKNNKLNILDLNGNLLFNYWVDNFHPPPRNLYNIKLFNNNFIKVKLNGKYNIINEKNKLISTIWFNYIHGHTYRNYVYVNLNNKHNLINHKGHLLLKTWVDNIQPYSDVCFKIKLNEKYNIINTSSKKECCILSDVWFDNITQRNNIFYVLLNNNYYILDNYGNIKYTTTTNQFINE